MQTDLNIKLYQEINKANEPRVYESWHASSLAQCPRAQYMMRVGIEPVVKPTASKVLRWEVGHKIEEAIRPYLENLYPNLGSNHRIKSMNLDFTGEYDNYNHDTKELIEIKSVHPFALKHLEKEGEPHPHYQLQQHGYVLLLRGEVEAINYIYIGLDGYIMTFRTEVKDDYIENVKTRLKILNKAWKNKVPPECICNQKDHPFYNSVMQYCQYKKGRTCCNIE